jgi:hypothetical protein
VAVASRVLYTSARSNRYPRAPARGGS